MSFPHRRQPFLSPTDAFSSKTYRRARRDTVDRIFANGFPYSRKLSAHNSCVNALAFSSGHGRFMASGGDDFRLHLWDFHQDELDAPSCSLTGPRGNVFTIAFSATNRYLYSGGTDETVLKYDISNLASPLSHCTLPRSPRDRITYHSESIRGIACHPFQDEIFLTAGDDGRVLLHDGRANNPMSRAQATLQITAEVTCVQPHPVMEHIFATSDSRGLVCLRDSRMTFGALTHRTREGVVQKYNTKLSKKSCRHLSNPESSSITFDREGSRLAVTMLHHLPTIYALSDANPLVTCSGRNLPDGTPVPSGQRTYSNCCTIKHGSFGGPGLENDDYYCSGSDDFRGYVWKIPVISKLTEDRKEISFDDWAVQELGDVVAFTEGVWAPRIVPVELSTPLCHLNGHQSIVNTTVMHPHLLHIVTSGIERDIVLHSPTHFSPCSQNLSLTSPDVRHLPEATAGDRNRFLRALSGSHFTLHDEATEPENETINMFDQILRDEGGADVFAVRQWLPDSDEEDIGFGSDVLNDDVDHHAMHRYECE